MRARRWNCRQPTLVASLAVLGVLGWAARSESAQLLTVMSENIYMGADPVPAFVSYLGGGPWAAEQVRSPSTLHRT